jgi:hypothetical protein
MEIFDEQNQRDYNIALDRLNTAKSKSNNYDQTSAYFAALSEEFDTIAQLFRSLPGSHVAKAQIEVCENYSKLCEENRIHRQNEENEQLYRNTLDSLNTARQKININKQKAEDFSELGKELTAIKQVFQSLPNSFDVKAQIEECENCRKLCEEKRQRKVKAEIRKSKNKGVLKKIKQSRFILCIIDGIIGFTIGGCIWKIANPDWMSYLISYTITNEVFGAILGVFVSFGDDIIKSVRRGVISFAIVFAFSIFSHTMSFFYGAFLGAIGGAIIGTLSGTLYYIQQKR